MAGAKYHRFIRMEQERLAELRYHASMARIYNKPVLTAWLGFRCYLAERWIKKHRHILDEEPDTPVIPKWDE